MEAIESRLAIEFSYQSVEHVLRATLGERANSARFGDIGGHALLLVLRGESTP